MKTLNLLLKLIFGITVFLSNISLFADEGGGGMDAGGGDVIACNKKLVGKFRYKEVYLADTYGLRKRLSAAVEDIPRSQILETIYMSLNEKEKGLGTAVQDVVENKLDFEFLEKRRHIKNNIPNLSDDNIDTRSLPKSCRVVQLAVQKISTGKVYVNNHLYRKLTFAEKDFFKVHEALIYIRKNPGKDTTEIRDMLFALGDGNFAELVEKVVIRDRLAGREYTKEQKVFLTLYALKSFLYWTTFYEPEFICPDNKKLAYGENHWSCMPAVVGAMKASDYLEFIADRLKTEHRNPSGLGGMMATAMFYGEFRNTFIIHGIEAPFKALETPLGENDTVYDFALRIVENPDVIFQLRNKKVDPVKKGCFAHCYLYDEMMSKLNWFRENRPYDMTPDKVLKYSPLKRK